LDRFPEGELPRQVISLIGGAAKKATADVSMPCIYRFGILKSFKAAFKKSLNGFITRNIFAA
jgi:hypothetical protein